MFMDKHFISMCGSPLWDYKTIYSNNPDFTFCFQYTLLIWLPCALLWIAAPIWMFKITKKSVYVIKLSWLTILKSILVILLILIQIVYLFKYFEENTNSIMVYYMTPLILISTYLLSLVFIHYERINGWRYSTLSFIFWLLLTMVSLITLRSKIINQPKTNKV